MSRIVDNLLAYKILTLLVTPFEQTKAFKLGIIDKHGNNLKKSSSLSTSEERDSYTYLNRLAFNMKKIINRLPGGESKIKSIVAALWLVKEYYESGNRTTSLMEDKYKSLLEVLNNNVILAEEEILVTKFFAEDGVVANVTGAAVSTNEPKIGKKNIKKYQIMARRKVVNVPA